MFLFHIYLFIFTLSWNINENFDFCFWFDVSCFCLNVAIGVDWPSSISQCLVTILHHSTEFVRNQTRMIELTFRGRTSCHWVDINGLFLISTHGITLFFLSVALCLFSFFLINTLLSYQMAGKWRMGLFHITQCFYILLEKLKTEIFSKKSGKVCLILLGMYVTASVRL